MSDKQKYFRCSKCGRLATSDDNVNGYPCLIPMPVRTSGLCGGYYSLITKKQYEKEISKSDREI